MNTAKNISLLYRKMNSMTNVKLIPFGLSNAKTMFLFCIYDNQPMSQTDICRELDMDKSTVAKMLMRLEKDGFIVRRINPDDTRSVLVSLTEKAGTVMEGAKQATDEWIVEATECLTDEEKETFFSLLEKVAQELGDADAGSRGERFRGR